MSQCLAIILTMSFDSATPTSNTVRVENFDDRKGYTAVFHHFFLHMRINEVTCTSGSNSVTVILNDVDFL